MERSAQIRTFLFLFLLLGCDGPLEENRWSRIPESAPPLSGPDKERIQVLFYNAGNLFDTNNDAGVSDKAFTPEGEYEWTERRYKEKLERIAEVLQMNGLPELVGLCEVENAKVLQDLLEQIPDPSHYGILHFECRDPRGIDPALLFDIRYFRPFDHKAHPVKNPSSGRPSRAILSIGLESAFGDSIRVFLNHWPSRAGGKEKSAASRMNASRILKERVEAVLRESPGRKLLIMGDLNDHPDDASVKELLDLQNGKLRDLMASHHQGGEGTYNFKGEWGVLDHFFLSPSLENASTGLRYKEESARIFKDEELLFYDPDMEVQRPDRYMDQGHYYGGYSDHLPIKMELVLEGKAS